MLLIFQREQKEEMTPKADCSGPRGCETRVNSFRKCGKIRKVRLFIDCPAFHPPCVKGLGMAAPAAAMWKKKGKKEKKGGTPDNFQSRGTAGSRSARLLWRDRNTMTQWQLPIWPRCQGERQKGGHSEALCGGGAVLLLPPMTNQHGPRSLNTCDGREAADM